MTILKPLKEVSSSESVAYYRRAVEGLSAPAPKQARILRTAAMRYLGQGFEVEIQVDDPKDVGALEKDFHAAHQHEYGFSMPGAPVEWVELRVAWEIPAQHWSFGEQPDASVSRAEPVTLWEYQSGNGGMGAAQPVKATATVHNRELLASGGELNGPMIVTEKDATTYIPTGWTGVTSRNGYLRIRKNG